MSQRTLSLEVTDKDIDRFFNFVEKLPNGCWYWTGARSRGKGNKKWYGSFSLAGGTVRAHRFSCEILGAGPLPEGHHRDHICCFSMCVNPDHLEIVTAAENQRRKAKR